MYTVLTASIHVYILRTCSSFRSFFCFFSSPGTRQMYTCRILQHTSVYILYMRLITPRSAREYSECKCTYTYETEKEAETSETTTILHVHGTHCACRYAYTCSNIKRDQKVITEHIYDCKECPAHRFHGSYTSPELLASSPGSPSCMNNYCE